MRKEREIINQVSRYGAYGILLQDSKILLTLKKSGPYKGRWGLPGGGIEFGETPEETLIRELLEEAAMKADGLELWGIATSQGVYEKTGERYHHIGIIYTVAKFILMTDLMPEEEGRWSSLIDTPCEELTPFAKHVLGRLEFFF